MLDISDMDAKICHAKLISGHENMNLHIIAEVIVYFWIPSHLA